MLRSSVGLSLSRRMGCTYIEGDDYHPPCNKAKMKSGQPLTDEDRWPWLDWLSAEMWSHAARYRQPFNFDLTSLKKA